jgi:hypothetical protein
MASITEKIRSTFSVDTDTRIADLQARIADARADIASATDAHGGASLTAHEPEAPKGAAAALTTATRNLDTARNTLADLEAALAAAQARKAREAAGAASAAARARDEAREAALHKALAAAAKLGQDLDLVAKSSTEFADAIEAMQSAFTAEEVGEHFGKALTAFPMCVGWRLRRLGLKVHPFMDDARAEWTQHLPSAAQVLGSKPKVAA